MITPSQVAQSAIDLFNDFIGAVIPGAVFIYGLPFSLGIYSSERELTPVTDPELSSLIFIAIAFAIGHGLLGIHHIARKCIPKLDRTKHAKKAIEATDAYRAVERYANRLGQPKTTEGTGTKDAGYAFNTVRSVAMSLSGEAALLARRCMFISLCCYGVSVALAILFLVSIHAQGLQLFCTELASSTFLGLSALTIALYVRGLIFENRALRTPFDIALLKLSSKEAQSDTQ